MLGEIKFKTVACRVQPRRDPKRAAVKFRPDIVSATDDNTIRCGDVQRAPGVGAHCTPTDNPDIQCNDWENPPTCTFRDSDTDQRAFHDATSRSYFRRTLAVSSAQARV